MKAGLSLFAAAVIVAGCAPQIQLTKVAHVPPANVVVVDKRQPAQLQRRHDALFSAVIFLEDARFTPRALDLYSAALAKADGQRTKFELEIQEFRIVDFYPVRLGAGGQGALGPLIFETLIDKNTDWAFVNDLRLTRTSDAIACIAIGKLNGAPFKLAVSEPYRISPFAGLVYNDPDFRRALDRVIEMAAAESLRQAKAAN